MVLQEHATVSSFVVEDWHQTLYNDLKCYQLRSRMITQSPYGQWLASQGFEHPSHEHPGIAYTNVYGQGDRADPMYPYALVRYIPEKRETRYSDPVRAHSDAPKGPGEHWQVLNLITGEIIAEPAQNPV